MKHSHYTKNVSHLSAIDVYRVLSLFGVTDQAIGHAIKKLLCPGQRGVKTKRQDIQEAIDTLERWKAMEDEDSAVQVVKVDLDSPATVSDDGLSAGYKVAIEPAAAIDDESPRMQAIGQNGNGGEHYDAEKLERWKRAPMDATHWGGKHGCYARCWYKFESGVWSCILDDGEDREWGEASPGYDRIKSMEPRP